MNDILSSDPVLYLMAQIGFLVVVLMIWLVMTTEKTADSS